MHPPATDLSRFIVVYSTSNIDPVDVTVTAVNDAPVVSGPGSVSVNESIAGSATSVTVTGVSVSDVDDTTVSSVTLTSLNGKGTLSIKDNVDGGLSAADISGNGTGSITICGTTLAKLNKTLAAGIKYTPTQDLNGSDTIRIVAKDPDLAEGVKDITVNINPGE